MASEKPKKKRSGKATTDYSEIDGVDIPRDRRCKACSVGGLTGGGWPCKTRDGVAEGRCLICVNRHVACQWPGDENDYNLGVRPTKRRRVDNEDGPSRTSNRHSLRRAVAQEAMVEQMRQTNELLSHMLATSIHQSRILTEVVRGMKKAGWIDTPDPEDWLKPKDGEMRLASEADWEELEAWRTRLSKKGRKKTAGEADEEDEIMEDKGKGTSKVVEEVESESGEEEEEGERSEVGEKEKEGEKEVVDEDMDTLA